MIEVGVLGPLQVKVNGVLRHVGGLKPQKLLLRLVLAAGKPVDVDDLKDTVWPGRRPANDGEVLHTMISTLRSKLGDHDRSVIVGLSQAYRIDPDKITADAARFEELVSQGQACFVAEQWNKAADLFDQALTLWRGDVVAPELDDVLHTGERALRELRVAAVEQKFEADLHCGRHPLLLGRLEPLCQEYPLREGLWFCWILALYRNNDRATAIRKADEISARLAERGLVPMAKLKALICDIYAEEDRLLPAVTGRPGLIWLNGHGEPARVDLDPAGPPVTIGRAEGNVVHLATDDLVSRHHAVIQANDGTWWLSDSNSTNGTSVNGLGVTAPVALAHGDTIQVGKSTIQVYLCAPQAPTAIVDGRTVSVREHPRSAGKAP